MPPETKDLTDEDLDELLKNLSQKYADRGQIIEAGWRGFVALFRRPTAPENSGAEEVMRFAFYAGAHHLFTSMLAMFPPTGGDVTDDDKRRFDALQEEVSDFAEIMKEAMRDRAH